MLPEAIILSFQVTAIYLLFQEGMLLGWLRIAAANLFDKGFGMKASRYIQKPLWDCLPCMASIWTCVLSWSIDWQLMLTVCGLNFLIQRAIIQQEDERIIDQ
jgi:hypothetical protein